MLCLFRNIVKYRELEITHWVSSLTGKKLK